ncbi:MAG: phosphoenolpyruvate carboxykinase (GTP) [Candidatus Bathyarchaeota archaeon]|nr:phosphoenolpyruvate carboxykinase (GTP) [Candidatus Bathyarchaeota archaeon]
MQSLPKYLDEKSLRKLKALDNIHVEEQVAKFLSLCKPAKATIITDDPEDIAYVRELAIRNGEEYPLAMEGHTIHWDGYSDQARDKANTKVLVTSEMQMSKGINTVPRDEGLEEVLGYMDGAMKGKECIIRFFSLGPTNSKFTLCALQFTDSSYVAHSEDILYRKGYEQFKDLRGSEEFFTFIHSAGELDDRNCTVNVDKRRIYIDLLDNKVYSVNNQYAGNSLGLKKLALRLAVYKANNEDWLAEHMLIMGVKPEGKNRTTYFTGAYPSACGKTSTAMIPGQSMVGDDIAYLKIDEDGNCKAVNIEQGVFGIITDVNPVDDPVIFKTLTTPREMIFSNVLVHEGKTYWLNMGIPESQYPIEGLNHIGEWSKGMKDPKDNEVGVAHRNARYTIRINELDNADPSYNDPEGLVIEGVLYGGRDSDTNVPVSQALSWAHGVYMGATIESETTSATLDQAGVRKSSPMAIMDFMVVPFGRYLKNHIDFGNKLKLVPLVFSTNYFLKHEGKYTNEKVDKKVWLIWAEGRVHGEYEAIETPIGYIPRYMDLKTLFRQVFDKDYTEDEYVQQFSIRVNKYLGKQARMEELYGDEEGIPEEFWKIHEGIKETLLALKEETGKSVLAPSYFQ